MMAYRRYFLPLIIFLAAIILQMTLPLHGDVGYLLYVAKLLLAGGTYGDTFLETNPPMILYLYSPIVIMEKFTVIDQTVLFRTYVFGLCLFSIATCAYLIKKIITDDITRYALLAGIMLSLLILPVNQFGQREHLFLILLLPYLFATSCMLANKSIPVYLSIVCSLLAGIGFCIKPYFVIIFIGINLFILLIKKNVVSCFNGSSLLIGAVMLIYLTSTMLLFPSYFDLMLPLINRFYITGITEPWLFIFTRPLVLFSFTTFIVYLMLRQYDQYPRLGGLLAFVLIGAIFAFLVTRTTWFYHTLPALGIACILLSYYFGQLVLTGLFKQPLSLASRVTTTLFATVTAGILFFPIVNIIYEQWQTGNTPPDLQQLSAYIAHAPGKRSVSCFSVTTTGDCFPLITDTHSQYGSRYPFFWWMRGLVFFPDQAGFVFLSDSVARDLDYYQPHWIIINESVPKYVFGDQFDYIQFFSRNPHFKQAWSVYQYRISFGRFRVYERG